MAVARRGRRRSRHGCAGGCDGSCDGNKDGDGGSGAAQVATAKAARRSKETTMAATMLCVQHRTRHAGASESVNMSVNMPEGGRHPHISGERAPSPSSAERSHEQNGDQRTRPGVNQEPAAEAGGGCLRLAPLPPRHMQCRRSQMSASTSVIGHRARVTSTCRGHRLSWYASAD